MQVLLGFLIVALLVLVVVQLSKVFELSSRLKANQDDRSYSINVNSTMSIIFVAVFLIGSVIFHITNVGKLMPTPASEHGHMVDNMFNWVLFFTTIVFVATQVALFVFAYIYREKKDVKPYYYSHNNTLEFWWTLIPAVTMSILVAYGLITWYKITGKASDEASVVEVTGKQFFWTIRYPGPDGQLGATDLWLVSGTNSLGIISEKFVEERKVWLTNEITKLEQKQMEVGIEVKALDNYLNDKFTKLNKKYEKSTHNLAEYTMDSLIEVLDGIPDKLEYYNKNLDAINLEYYDENGNMKPILVNAGLDDVIATDKLVLEKGQEVLFKIKSFDVLHSFALPHFRVKMDAVPGIPTQFKMTPKYTSQEYREEVVNDPDFKFELACQELCGKGHNSMQMEVVVLDQEEFKDWYAAQPSYHDQKFPKPEMSTEDAISIEPADAGLQVEVLDVDPEEVEVAVGP